MLSQGLFHTTVHGAAEVRLILTALWEIEHAALTFERQEMETQSNIFWAVEEILEIISPLIRMRKQNKRREVTWRGSQHRISTPSGTQPSNSARVLSVCFFVFSA